MKPSLFIGFRFASAPMALVLALVTGCENDTGGGDATSRGAGETKVVRIVSFSPAISRTLVDLDVQAQIVGRTPHCASLPPDIPVVGDLLAMNYEQLVRLQPTHVLVQPPSAGIDAALVELAREKDWTIGQWHLDGVDDIRTMLRELPGALYPVDSAERRTCESKANAILRQIDSALQPRDLPLFRGRVLMFASVDPVMVFGKGTYLDDVLTALGGTNAAAAEGWAELSMEDVVRLNPQAMIIVQPGAASNQSIADLAGPLMTVEVEAVRTPRIAVLRHPDAFLPSSAVADVAVELRAILRSFEAGGS